MARTGGAGPSDSSHTSSALALAAQGRSSFQELLAQSRLPDGDRHLCTRKAVFGIGGMPPRPLLLGLLRQVCPPQPARHLCEAFSMATAYTTETQLCYHSPDDGLPRVSSPVAPPPRGLRGATTAPTSSAHTSL